jgi:hypothetical protein
MLLDRDDNTSEEEEEAQALAMGTGKGVSALSALEEGMPEVESGLGDLSVADQLVRPPSLRTQSRFSFCTLHLY